MFEGEGFTKGELELVEKLSAELPVPFMRIDFLKTSKELVFGEFTPKPGNYDEFNQKTDQSLGEMYLEAEYKLIDDLINGKKFSCFKEIYRKVAIQKNDSKEEDM
ncbi:teichuronopeptide biosynthesis, partial [Pseudomonas sp. 2588-5]